MRNVINKGLTEEDIISGAGQAFEGGWNKVKLYFHAGASDRDRGRYGGNCWFWQIRLPEDITRSRRISEMANARLRQATSFFIPKPFTPFQWAPMLNHEDYIERAAIVKHAFLNQLNKKSLRYNWHDAEVSVLEGVFARGRRRRADRPSRRPIRHGMPL